ncbi:hypothetical protein EVAR_66075_1 [Eumeta japonica]|uniref:Uncharacterized protein n=1 Tax=Eumeta variegata TaxID=151549 RepID=A0A4C2A2A2_EUMVA|nr:hypothetical protein EVAR_66075_1 [Eumeta japonica]
MTRVRYEGKSDRCRISGASAPPRPRLCPTLDVEHPNKECRVQKSRPNLSRHEEIYIDSIPIPQCSTSSPVALAQSVDAGRRRAAGGGRRHSSNCRAHILQKSVAAVR